MVNVATLLLQSPFHAVRNPLRYNSTNNNNIPYAFCMGKKHDAHEREHEGVGGMNAYHEHRFQC